MPRLTISDLSLDTSLLRVMNSTVNGQEPAAKDIKEFSFAALAKELGSNPTRLEWSRYFESNRAQKKPRAIAALPANKPTPQLKSKSLPPSNLALPAAGKSFDVTSVIADRAAGIPYGRPGDQYDPNFSITKQGICEGSANPMCAAGLAAAGLPGPYFSETKTYSTACMLGVGVIVKGGGAVAGNAAASQVSRLAMQLGAGARTMSLVGRGVAIFTNPVTAAGSLGFAIGPLLEHCEVKPPVLGVK